MQSKVVSLVTVIDLSHNPVLLQAGTFGGISVCFGGSGTKRDSQNCCSSFLRAETMRKQRKPHTGAQIEPGLWKEVVSFERPILTGRLPIWGAAEGASG